MTLADIENYLSSFERTLKEFNLDLESKTSERVLASSVWMRDKLSLKVNNQLKPLLSALQRFESEPSDSGIENNIKISIKHCKELITVMDDLLMTYVQAVAITDMKIKWAHSLQKMKEHTTHLRNRVNIIKGLKAQEKDPRSWLPF